MPRSLSDNALLGVCAYRLISSLNAKNYPQNINYMLAVIFRVCLDLNENCYCQTASQEAVNNPENTKEVGKIDISFRPLVALVSTLLNYEITRRGEICSLEL